MPERGSAMAEQVPAVGDVLDRIERREWDRLRRLPHPEVHWIDRPGVTFCYR